MTVYLIQSTKRRDPSTGALVDKFDIHKATRYGEVVELLPGGPVVTSAAPMVTTLRHKLRGFGDGDYLLALGGPAEIGAATAVASSMNAGRVTMLVWDKPTRDYIPVRLDVHGQRTHGALEHG